MEDDGNVLLSGIYSFSDDNDVSNDERTRGCVWYAVIMVLCFL